VPRAAARGQPGRAGLANADGKIEQAISTFFGCYALRNCRTDGVTKIIEDALRAAGLIR
jgi:hypothetical protein